MKDLHNILEKYARLTVEVWINLKEGEGLIITTTTEGLPLSRLVAKEAYKAGAKHVEISLNDDEMTLMRYKYGSRDVFESFPEWKVTNIRDIYDDNYHHVFIISPDPELLKSVDQEKVNINQKTQSTAMAPVMKYRMTGLTKWVIVAVPSIGWAKSIFPHDTDDVAVEKLWDYIIKATRLDHDDPVESWKIHDDNLKKYENFLNESDFLKLKLEGPGTDLEVYLAEDHHWIGGSNDDIHGVAYMANIPTEEVFTTPHAYKVNGTLKATKPLSVHGNLINNFGFTFEDGKVVDFFAEEGYDVLKNLLDSDDGAKRLGEVALVQDDSPISNTKILFNNTLFDENASVHFALGRAYGYAIKNGTTMTLEELDKKGANYSLIHVDFMVGGPELQITAYRKNGEEVQLFKDGNWTI